MSSVASSVPIPTVNILVPVGALGLGVKESDVFARLPDAHAIACDAGSTDSGPAYLATGVAKYSRDSIKHDLSILMRAQAKAGIPLLIGSCGTSGGDLALEWTRDIALEIARILERGARADQSIPGHGIGLAIVRDIMQVYDGELSIENSSGGGLSVILYFEKSR